MIRLKLAEANYRCKVIDHHDREYLWIDFADSPKELEERLLARGFKSVERVKPFTLARWRARAKTETDRIIQWCLDHKDKKTGDYKWRDRVWKYLKAYLYSASNGKCAFCETDTLIASPGDVEHFRPKARVEGEEEHRGYYWLAYRLENYLPSCGNCNTSGKANYFPVSGKRALSPDDDLRVESPDLLNPLDPDEEEPSEHLKFVAEPGEKGAGDEKPKPVGLVWSATHRGNQTIKILKLNRDPLLVSRAEHIYGFLQKLDNAYLDQLQLKKLGVERNCVGELIEKETSGRSEYCAAKLAAVPVWVKHWEERRALERQAFANMIKNF